MRSAVRKRPSPAMVVALIALFVALGGGAYAASQINGALIKKNSEPGNRIKKNTFVAKATFATNANHATSAGSATNASHASNSDNAGHATNADNASHATNADNATSAGNATNLGGQPASSYMSNGAVQRGTTVLAQGASGQTIFSDGPLSLTADCQKSGSTLTVTVHEVSSVDNWLSFSTLEATAGSVQNTTVNDGTGNGSFFGNTNRIDATAPGGQSMRGQLATGVNWPTAGSCYVSAFVVTS
jgi:hypothetical protein